jgi:hypothetical protein
MKNKLIHFQKYKFRYEIVFLFMYLLINNGISATSVIMEAGRKGESEFQLWEPFVWEYSSAIGVLCLFPAIILLLKKLPFSWINIKKSLAIYLVSSVIFSACHITIMVAIRKVIYWLQGRFYDFGDIGFELLYEYRKDLWGFIFLIVLIKSYGFILSRLQGEANPVVVGEDESTNSNIERLLVKKLGKEFIIRVEDIEWLESAGNYVNLHIKQRIYPIRASMSNLIPKIERKGFCRIHRSFAINLDLVDSITPLSSGDSEVKLNNGKILNLSRRYKEEFKLRLA